MTSTCTLRSTRYTPRRFGFTRPLGPGQATARCGSRDDRPGLDACLKALREGDVLIVWKLDRLGRSLRHLVNTVEDLAARGVGFKVLAGQGANIDTTTPAGKFFFELGVARSTLYSYVGPDGRLRDRGRAALEKSSREYILSKVKGVMITPLKVHSAL